MTEKTIKYIKIPAGDAPIEQCSYTGVIELTNDTFVDNLRTIFA